MTTLRLVLIMAAAYGAARVDADGLNRQWTTWRKDAMPMRRRKHMHKNTRLNQVGTP